MDYHIKCSKCPPSANTYACVLVFHSVVNGFLR